MANNFEIWKKSFTFEIATREGGFSSTKAICNKGLSGNLSILPRLNFRIGGQETAPQFLTAHTLNRWAKFYGKFV